MTHAYDASHLRNSGSGIDDSGIPDPPKPYKEHLGDGVYIASDGYDGVLLTRDHPVSLIYLTDEQIQKLLAYVEKWK